MNKLAGPVETYKILVDSPDELWKSVSIISYNSRFSLHYPSENIFFHKTWAYYISMKKKLHAD